MIIAATRYGTSSGRPGGPVYQINSGTPPTLYKDAETGNWELVFEASCQIVFTKDLDAQVFAVGGGQSGSQYGDSFDGTPPQYANAYADGGNGGNGGGRVTTAAHFTNGTVYTFTIGAHDSDTSVRDGNDPYVVNVTARSGEGESGGAGAHASYSGSDGENGDPGAYAFGQQTTQGLIYSPSRKYGAGGGGGGAKVGSTGSERPAGNGGETGGGNGGAGQAPGANGRDGAANTGAGGGGGACHSTMGNYNGQGGAGGSGIVIIRNVRTST